jgi:hypothetical protein
MKVMQTGIAATRIFKTLPTPRELIQRIFAGHGWDPPAKIALLDL